MEGRLMVMVVVEISYVYSQETMVVEGMEMVRRRCGANWERFRSKLKQDGSRQKR